MTVLARRPIKYLLLYGGALLLAVVVGAVVAYSEKYGGDNGPYVLLGALPVIVIAGVILVQWRIGAVVLVAALPYDAILTLGPLASGIKALALLTFLSLALALLTDRKLLERFTSLWRQPLTLAVLAFVFWVAASVAWAPDKGATLGATATYLGVFGVMIVIGLLERRYLVLAWASLIFSAALSVPGGYVLPVPEGSDMAVSGRFGPGGAGPDTYGCLMTIAFFVAYFGVLRRHRIIAYLLTPVFLYGIFATGSRTALIALVVTPLLAMLVPRLATRLGWRTIPMYILGAAALAVLFLAIPSVGQIVSERYTSLSQIQSEQTWAGRWSIWEGAIEISASHPILGVGEGNFADFALENSETVAAHSARKQKVSGVAHNMFLGVVSQLGLVGLGLFLAALFFVFKAALSIARASGLGTSILLGLIAAMIAGMTLTWESYPIVYVLFGSVLALQLQNSDRGEPLLDRHEGFN